jgi:hypothetical protein
MQLARTAGSGREQTLGSILGVPTTRQTLLSAEHAAMKKLLLILLAVTALLVLALGGWVVGSVRRAPAYA